MKEMHHHGDVAAARYRFQFRLRSLLLLMTWLAVGLGLLRAVPLLGGVFVVLSMPALARTVRWNAECEASGCSLSTRKLIRVFLASLAIVVVMAATSMLVVLSAALSAGLWGLVALTSLCQVVFRYASRFHTRLRAAARSVRHGMMQLVPATRQCIRRTRSGIAAWPLAAAMAVASIAVAGISMTLLAVLLFCLAAHYASDHLARVPCLLRWLFARLSAGTVCLIGIDARMLKKFFAPGTSTEKVGAC
jgi:hypothetical protein